MIEYTIKCLNISFHFTKFITEYGILSLLERRLRPQVYPKWLYFKLQVKLSHQIIQFLGENRMEASSQIKQRLEGIVSKRKENLSSLKAIHLGNMFN